MKGNAVAEYELVPFAALLDGERLRQPGLHPCLAHVTHKSLVNRRQGLGLFDERAESRVESLDPTGYRDLDHAATAASCDR